MADPGVDDRQTGDLPPQFPGGSALPDVSYGIGGYPLQSYAPTKNEPTDIGKLLGPEGSLTKAQGDYTEKAGRVYDQMDSLINADVARAHRAYDATAISPEEFPKWNEKEEREKFLHNPIEAFGSVASLFAIVASAFTRAPMENALNGAAAAITATRAGDMEALASAHQAWKENTDLAFKRHQMMRENYDDALKLMSTDMLAGRSKLENYARQYGDQQTLLYMQAGLDDKAFKLWTDRDKAILTAKETANKLTEFDLVDKVLQSDENWNTQDKTGKSAGYRLEAWARTNGVLKDLQSGDPRWQQAGIWMLQNPKAKPAEANEVFKQLGIIPQYYASTAKAAERADFDKAVGVERQKIDQQYPREDFPDLDDAARDRMAQRNVTKQNAEDKRGITKTSDLQTRIKAYRDAHAGASEQDALDNIDAMSVNQQRVDIQRRLADLKESQFNTHEEFMEEQAKIKNELAKTALAQKALPKSLKDRTITEMADRIEATKLAENLDVSPQERGKIHTDAVLQAIGDYSAANKSSNPVDPAAVDLMANRFFETGQVPVGIGRSGALVSAFWKRVGELGPQRYGSPEAAAKAIKIAQAEFEGLKAAERTAAQRLTSITIATQDAANLLGPLEQASALVPRGQFPKANEWRQWIAKESGDPNIRQFQASMTSFLSAYTRALSPTGVPTDTARNRAFDLLTTADSPKAFNAVIKQLQTEMDAVLAAPVQVLARMRTEYGGTWSPQQKAEADKAAKAFTNSKVVNGKTYYQWSDGTIHDDAEYK